MVDIKILVLNIVLLWAVQNYSQPVEKTKAVTLNYNRQPLSSVLEDIQTQSGVNFVYRDKLVDGLKVTCQIEDKSVEGAIKKILSGFDISYKVFPKDSYVLFKEKKPAEKRFRAVLVRENSPYRDTVKALIEPKLISKNSLVYPQEAIQYNIEGKVKVDILVNKDGNAYRVQIVQSSGSAILDSTAIEYARNLKFIPAQVEGKPRNIWVAMLFKYFLENK